MFKFLRSQSFWLTAAHFAVAGLGAYMSYMKGTPLPLVITGGINALVKSPIAADKNAAAEAAAEAESNAQ